MEKIERLTERVRGVAQPVWYDKTIPCRQMDCCPEGDCVNAKCDFAIIIERLAAYEDIGLSPEEVATLKNRFSKRRTSK